MTGLFGLYSDIKLQKESKISNSVACMHAQLVLLNVMLLSANIRRHPENPRGKGESPATVVSSNPPPLSPVPVLCPVCLFVVTYTPLSPPLSYWIFNFD